MSHLFLSLLAGMRYLPAKATLYSGAAENGILDLGVTQHPFLFLQNRDVTKRSLLGLGYNEWEPGEDINRNESTSFLPEYAFSPGRLFPIGNSRYYRAGENFYAYAAMGGPGRVVFTDVDAPWAGNHALGEMPVAYILASGGSPLPSVEGGGYVPRIGVPGFRDFYLGTPGTNLARTSASNQVVLTDTTWSMETTAYRRPGRLVLFGSELVHASPPNPGGKVTTGWKPEMVWWLSATSPGHWMVHSRTKDTANNEYDHSKSFSGAPADVGSRTDNRITWHDDGYTLSFPVFDSRYDISSDTRVLAFRSYE